MEYIEYVEMRDVVSRFWACPFDRTFFFSPTDGRINGGNSGRNKSCRKSRVCRDTFRSDNSRLVDIKCVYTSIYF